MTITRHTARSVTSQLMAILKSNKLFINRSIFRIIYFTIYNNTNLRDKQRRYSARVKQTQYPFPVKISIHTSLIRINCLKGKRRQGMRKDEERWKDIENEGTKGGWRVERDAVSGV